MEVYATLVESADHEVGRLADAFEEIGELDNTIFIYIAGDNGGSSIGEINGVFLEWSALNGAPEDIPYLESAWTNMADRGPTRTTPSPGRWPAPPRPPGASRCRMPAETWRACVVRWPKGIKAKGEKRTPVCLADRHRADDPRGHRHPGAEDRQRRPADPDRRHLDDLLLRRCRRSRAAHHAVQRGHRQPQHLPRRLAGRGRPPGAVGAHAARRQLRGRRLGALPHGRRLRSGPGRGGPAPRQAGGDEGPLPRGGHQVRRTAARRPRLPAAQPAGCRPSGPDVRPHRAHRSTPA